MAKGVPEERRLLATSCEGFTSVQMVLSPRFRTLVDKPRSVAACLRML